MKRIILAFTCITVAVASCEKAADNTQQAEKGIQISIEANAPAENTPDQTKTQFGPDFTSVLWENTDMMTVVVGKPDGTFTQNTRFTKGNGANEFTGLFENGNAPAENGTNTYFALYPYDKTISTVGNDGKRNTFYVSPDKTYSIHIAPGTQNGLNNMDHIHVPLLGTGTVEGTASPRIEMQNIVGIFKVTVVNPGKTALAIKSVTLSNDGTEEMSGPFRFNLSTNDYPLLESISGNPFATLEVTGCTIEAGKSGDFYVMVPRIRFNKETTAKNFEIKVSTDKDFVTKTYPIDPNNGYVFEAGKIHRARVDYTGASGIETGLDIPARIDFKEITAQTDYIGFSGKTDPANVKFKNETLRITKDSQVIINTKETPSGMTLEAVEWNNGGTTKATLEIYGSTDNKNYELLVRRNDLKNNRDDKGQRTTIDITAIKPGMKYFRFDNITAKEEGNNRCVAIFSIDFKK